MKSYVQRGFTFVELLVVISIIAILSAVVYASFGDARNSARNKALMAEVKEVQLALEVYKAQNNSYPLPADGPCRSGGAIISANTNESGCNVPIIDGLVPDFISELPDPGDSARSQCNMRYTTDTAGTFYKLSAINCYETVGGSAGLTSDSPMARCPSSCTTESYCDAGHSLFNRSFAVYSQGGQCE